MVAINLNILYRYKNGNYFISILEDGTKIRESNDDKLIADFPESLDIKIEKQEKSFRDLGNKDKKNYFFTNSEINSVIQGFSDGLEKIKEQSLNIVSCLKLYAEKQIRVIIAYFAESGSLFRSNPAGHFAESGHRSEATFC